MLDSDLPTVEVFERASDQPDQERPVASELFALVSRSNARLVELATTDGLTGLRNRRYFRESLAAAVRHPRSVSIAIVHVDELGPFTDAFGRLCGETVLTTIAQKLRAAVRFQDLIARYGDEEFAVLLPYADPDGSRIVAERLRGIVEGHPWPLLAITVSVGVTTRTATVADAAAMLEHAVHALYRSKLRGSNRITHHQDPKWGDDPRGD